jgi:hypothetical protein
LRERIQSLTEQLEGNLGQIEALTTQKQELEEALASLQERLGDGDRGEPADADQVEIPVGPNLVNSRPRLEGAVGSATVLDPTSLFRIEEAAAYSWEQMLPDRYSLEHVTNHVGELSDASAESPSFTPAKPGNYRFRLTATDSEGHPNINEVDVWITKEGSRSLELEGAIYADLFEWLGTEEFNLNPGTDAGRDQVLDHGQRETGG